MSSLTMEVETSSRDRDETSSWPGGSKKSAQMCRPDRVHWCDGSSDEYQAMLQLMVLAGTAIPLDEKSVPTAFWCDRIRAMSPA